MMEWMRVLVVEGYLVVLVIEYVEVLVVVDYLIVVVNDGCCLMRLIYATRFS